ncbi:apolipoprotein N-acyltransferase [soil metagenome]
MTRHISFTASSLIALFAGVLNIFAFAPFGFWPLQIATLALMFWLALREPSVSRNVVFGYAYGFGWSVCGVYWLYISMHTYGGMPAIMAAIAVALMGLCLGAFSAFAFGVAAWMRQRWSSATAISLLLILPPLWALSEWMRGWVLTGFPWVVSGYAHNQGPLSGFAPVGGVYGIGLLAALIAGSLALLPSKGKPAISGLLLSILIFGSGFALKSIAWTEPSGQPISVRLLQGNVSQESKFAEGQTGATLAQYYDMIRAAPADLIATPETAIPVLLGQLPPDYLPLLSAYARQSNSHLALGVPINDGPGEYANSLLVMSPTSAASEVPGYRYDKHHLVPFGEFIPFGFRWFVSMMNIPLGEFKRGPSLQAPFAVKDQQVLPNICYEDLFGGEISAQISESTSSGKAQATILMNVTNIGWFGNSLALPQHLQISQMRALETGRPMLRVTNTGTTAFIDQSGNVVSQLPPFTRGTLEARVQGYRGWTPFILLGNRLAVLLACAMLGLAWLGSRRNRS